MFKKNLFRDGGLKQNYFSLLEHIQSIEIYSSTLKHCYIHF